jgi:hypothetical protein
MRIQEVSPVSVGKTDAQQPLLKAIRDAVSASNNVNPDWKSQLIAQIDRSHATTHRKASIEIDATED